MLRHLRRLAISRICALWLVTLILTPFTAPFKTYDVASSQSDRSCDGLPKDKVSSDEGLAGPSGPALAPPAPDIVGVKPVASPNHIEEHRFQYSILRV